MDKVHASIPMLVSALNCVMACAVRAQNKISVAYLIKRHCSKKRPSSHGPIAPYSDAFASADLGGTGTQHRNVAVYTNAVGRGGSRF